MLSMVLCLGMNRYYSIVPALGQGTMLHDTDKMVRSLSEKCHVADFVS